MRIKSFQLIIDIIRGKAIPIGINKLRVYKKLANKDNVPLVKVIGDSHVSFFAGHDDITLMHFRYGINNGCDKIKNFLTFHVGPALAYNLNRYNSNTKAREKIDYLISKKYIRPKDTVLLCFGCIDTSRHIYKHISSETTIEDVCKNIIDNYFEFIDSLKLLNINVYIWAPLPRAVYIEDNTPISDINKAVKIFNNLLIERAEKSNIAVLSIYDKLINSDNIANREYYSDGIHLNKNAWKLAKEEMKKINILKDTDLGIDT